MLAKIQPLIENSLITSNQISLLGERKVSLLKSLRGNFAGLIEAIGLPKQYERSALTHGNVYKNMYELAKQNGINNGEISPAVEILKKGLTNTRPRL